MRRLLTALVVAATLSFGNVAGAAPADPREAARDLGYRGIEHFENGEFLSALNDLTRATEMYSAPTLWLWRARTLARLGRLVEAANDYRSAADAPLPDDADEALRGAQRDARAELAALESRIPRLRVTWASAESVVVVTIDGKRRSLHRSTVLLLDPGAHVFETSAGLERRSRRISVVDGESGTIELDVSAGPPMTERSGRSRPPDRLAAHRSSPSSGSRQTWGILSTGVGAAGILVGLTAGGFALRKRDQLRDVCHGGECPVSVSGEVDTYNSARAISTTGFVVGAVGLGVGVTLLLWKPSESTRGQGGLRATAGLEGLRVTVTE